LIKYCLNFDQKMYVCENLQIMVRTRGLRRVLVRVIGRALGRGDNRDSDDVLQQWRPTTFTRRQREAAAVAEELFQHTEEVVDDAEGFPGGHCDTSVLTTYADHVAVLGG